MRKLLSLLLLATSLFGLYAFLPKADKGHNPCSGIVSDPAGAPLKDVAVLVLSAGKWRIITQTDDKGQYKLELSVGTHQIEFSKKGFESHRFLGVQVYDKQPLLFNVTLTAAQVDEAVVVSNWQPQPEAATYSSTTAPISYASGAELKRSSAASGARESAKMKTAPGMSPAMSAPPPPPPLPMVDEVESMAYDKVPPATDDIMRDVDTKAFKVPLVKSTEADLGRVIVAEDTKKEAERKEGPAPEPTKPAPNPRAGLLTAGEWNDLDNWSHHWVDMLVDGEINDHQNTYKMWPRHRYTVLLQNELGNPIIDARLQLTDGGTDIIWEARTDNTGKAELWHRFFEQKDAATAGTLRVVAIVDGKNHTLGTPKPYAAGINVYQIKRECAAPRNVDIVWAVDATGSMGDEIEYLKTELLDVIGRVKNLNPDLAVRMGSVFYRDQTDDYIVKSSGLSPDIARTVEYIRQQFAGGGGDMPEAVHSALEEAIFNQKWSETATARICFLVLDASPHQEPQVIESLQRSIREAARRGIRIIPVSASGVQKDTEFLMKFFGLATNGSYVFLTDHSGIGGKHLAPTTDEYKVELLNDLLVRLISQYVAVENCEGQTAIRFEQGTGDQQQNTLQNLPPALFYPNPASDQVTLDLPFDAQKITLYDAEGKAVQSMTNVATGRHTIPVRELPAGFYTLRIWKDAQVQSGKVLVVRL